MNIYINGRFLTQSITGVQRYAIEFVKSLDRMIGEDSKLKKYKFFIIVPRKTKIDISLSNIEWKKTGIMRGQLWEQIELPLYSCKGFLINLGNTAPIIKINQIITLHDVAFYAYPKSFSFVFRNWYKFLFLIFSKTLRQIITVSDFSKNEIYRYCGISKSKIIVSYLGIDHFKNINKDDKALKEWGIQNTPYVFAVSSMNPNKNFKSILDVAKINPDINFVIAGGKNFKIFGKEILDFPENVKHIGYVRDEELVTLYQHASCFVYPSIYEGFGIPPLEAMSCGCPVVTSNVASIPEVCGNAALYCNPFDVKDISQQIKKIYFNKELAKKMSTYGVEYVKKYSWNKMTREIITNIESINY